MTSLKMNLISQRTVAGLALAFCVSSSMAETTSWNAAGDFSTTTSSGANGVWSYGSTGSSLSGAFSAFDTEINLSGYSYWGSGVGTEIGKAGPAQEFSSGSVLVPANTIDLNPGSGGEYTVLRYTAQTAGVYAINAGFWGNDFVGPTTTDVHVRTNGADLFSGFINSYGVANGDAWNGTLRLAAGQTVDFSLGFGQNHTWNFDNTGLSANISEVSPVPEPEGAAMLLAGLGLVGLTASRRKRRVQVHPQSC